MFFYICKFSKMVLLLVWSKNFLFAQGWVSSNNLEKEIISFTFYWSDALSLCHDLGSHRIRSYMDPTYTYSLSECFEQVTLPHFVHYKCEVERDLLPCLSCIAGLVLKGTLETRSIKVICVVICHIAANNQVRPWDVGFGLGRGKVLV